MLAYVNSVKINNKPHGYHSVQHPKIKGNTYIIKSWPYTIGSVHGYAHTCPEFYWLQWDSCLVYRRLRQIHKNKKTPQHIFFMKSSQKMSFHGKSKENPFIINALDNLYWKYRYFIKSEVCRFTARGNKAILTRQEQDVTRLIFNRLFTLNRTIPCCPVAR